MAEILKFLFSVQGVAGQKPVSRQITEEMYTLLLKRQPGQGQHVQSVTRQAGTIVTGSIVAPSSSAPAYSAATIQLPSSGNVSSQAAAQALGAGGQIIATPTAFAVSQNQKISWLSNLFHMFYV